MALASAAAELGAGQLGDPVSWFVFPVALAYLGTGAVLLLRRDWHPVGWLLCGLASAQAVLVANNWGTQVVEPVLGIPPAWWHWVGHVMTYGLFWPSFIALFVVFPDGFAGRPPRQQRIGRALLYASIPFILAALFTDHVRVVVDGPLVANPTGLGVVPLEVVEAPFVLSMLLALVLLAAAHLVLRSRNPSPRARLQHRWLLVAAGILMAWLPVGVIGAEITGNQAWWYPIFVAYIGVPVAIAIAITRYRLYEIDRIVSRTLSYLAVVVLLGAGYAVMVLTMRGLLPVEGDLPVAVSTLVVAVAFLPLARRVQRFVDRRFFRSRYDAGQVVARFADQLQGSLDLAAVTDRTEQVVSEVLTPVAVRVWVAEDLR